MRLYLFIFIIFFCSKTFYAQKNNDFGLWNNIAIEKKLNKTIDLNLEVENRLQYNLNYIDKTFLEFSGDKKLSKAIKISLGYRYTNQFKFSEYTGVSHRFLFTLKVKRKFIENLKLSYRFRIQNEYKNYISSEFSDNIKILNRHKIDVEYEINNFFSPSIYSELFFNTQFNLIKYRVGVSNSIKLNKHNEIDVFYLYQNIEFIQNEYVLGIGYTYKL